jgi:hypothetical protein
MLRCAILIAGTGEPPLPAAESFVGLSSFRGCRRVRATTIYAVHLSTRPKGARARLPTPEFVGPANERP